MLLSAIRRPRPQVLALVVIMLGGGCEGGPPDRAVVRSDASAARAIEAGTVAPPGPFGWSWSNPRPQGNPLNAVVSAGPLHLLAVGRGGTVLRSASGGDSWSVVASGTERDLAAVWAAAGSSAWAVGAGGTILHSPDAGRSWEVRSAGTREDLTGVWSAGGGHVIVVGHRGTVLRSTDRGRTWASEPAGVQDDLFGIWGRARDDVWAVGDNGTIVHYDGIEWARQPAVTTLPLHSIVGGPVGDVWAVGGLHPVDGEGSRPGRSIVLRGRPGRWRVLPTRAPAALHAITLVPAMGLVAVGGQGTVLRSALGASWRNVSREIADLVVAPFGGPEDLQGVAGSDGGVVHIVGGRGVVVRSGNAGASWASLREGSLFELTDVWASSPDDLWVVGWTGTLLRSRDRGGHWTKIETGVSGHLLALWGKGPDEVWVVGSRGTILKARATGALEPHQSGVSSTLRAVWGADDDVWVVGDGGVVLRGPDRSGGFATLDAGVTQDLAAVWGSGPEDVWLAGRGGVLLRTRDRGRSFQRVDTGTRQILASIGGTGPDDVWVVGGMLGNTTILHGTAGGTRWSRHATGGHENLIHVLALDETQVLVVGWEFPRCQSVLTTIDGGGRWDAAGPCTTAPLAALWPTSPDELWAVGSDGAILRGTRE